MRLVSYVFPCNVISWISLGVIMAVEVYKEQSNRQSDDGVTADGLGQRAENRC